MNNFRKDLDRLGERRDTQNNLKSTLQSELEELKAQEEELLNRRKYESKENLIRESYLL